MADGLAGKDMRTGLRSRWTGFLAAGGRDDPASFRFMVGGAALALLHVPAAGVAYFGCLPPTPVTKTLVFWSLILSLCVPPVIALSLAAASARGPARRRWRLHAGCLVAASWAVAVGLGYCVASSAMGHSCPSWEWRHVTPGGGAAF